MQADRGKDCLLGDCHLCRDSSSAGECGPVRRHVKRPHTPPWPRCHLDGRSVALCPRLPPVRVATSSGRATTNSAAILRFGLRSYSRLINRYCIDADARNRSFPILPMDSVVRCVTYVSVMINY